MQMHSVQRIELSFLCDPQAYHKNKRGPIWVVERRWGLSSANCPEAELTLWYRYRCKDHWDPMQPRKAGTKHSKYGGERGVRVRKQHDSAWKLTCHSCNDRDGKLTNIYCPTSCVPSSEEIEDFGIWQCTIRSSTFSKTVVLIGHFHTIWIHLSRP